MERKNKNWVQGAIKLLNQKGLYKIMYPLASCKNFFVNKILLSNGVFAYGNGAQAEIAQIRCLGEVFERLSLQKAPNKLLTSPYNKHHHPPMVNPSHYQPIASKQFHWVHGISLSTQKDTLIPSSLIYKDTPRSEILSPSQTIGSGAAGGFDKEQCLLGGLYELVERDCFMTITKNKIVPPAIDLDKLRSVYIQKLIEQCCLLNYKYCLFEITNDLTIPSFMVIVENKTPKTYATGIKSNLNPIKAIIGALEEALAEMIIRSKEGRSKYMHAPYFFSQERQKGILSYEHLNESIPASVELKRALGILQKKHIEIYALNTSFFWLAQIKYQTWRVISPHLQPYYYFFRHAEIREGRLRTVEKFFSENGLNKSHRIKRKADLVAKPLPNEIIIINAQNNTIISLKGIKKQMWKYLWKTRSQNNIVDRFSQYKNINKQIDFLLKKGVFVTKN